MTKSVLPSEMPGDELASDQDEALSKKANQETSPLPKRDPLLGAAIIKLSMLTNRNGQGGLFRSVYAGLLQDLSLTDAEVDAYLKSNWAAVHEHLK